MGIQMHGMYWGRVLWWRGVREDGQGKQTNNEVWADMVSSFNLIPQGILEYEFHHRAPSKAWTLACAVPMSVSHWLPLDDRHDLTGQGQFSRAGAPVTANIVAPLLRRSKRDTNRATKESYREWTVTLKHPFYYYPWIQSSVRSDSLRGDRK